MHSPLIGHASCRCRRLAMSDFRRSQFVRGKCFQAAAGSMARAPGLASRVNLGSAIA